MKNHDLTNLEDEWKPIFDIINSNFGIPFAQGRAFLDTAVEWFENEPKSSWSEESLSHLSSSSSSEGEIGDILDYYANDRGEVGFDEDESTVVNGEDKGAVAVGENNKSSDLTDEGPNELIPWTLFRPRVAPEDYLRGEWGNSISKAVQITNVVVEVPERRYKRS
jgi:hypothetical protein